MQKFKQTISRPGLAIPILLLGVCLVSYAPLMRSLSFYWDDMAVSWIASSMGAAGLARYFSTNRPIWGLLFQLTTPILGSVPWHWQVFDLFWRWLACVLFWVVLRLTLPGRPRVGLYAALLMAVYPALPVQFIAMMFSHFFIVLDAFFGSLICSLLALKMKGARFWLLTAAGLALGLVNLVTLEYFLPLELLRPLLLWVAISTGATALQAVQPQPSQKPPQKIWILNLKRAFLAWLPYLLLLVGAGVWRTLFFRYQNQNYEYVLLNDLRAAPLPALLNLARTVLTDLWTVTFAAWGQALALPDIVSLGRLTTLAYGLICVGVILVVFFILNHSSFCQSQEVDGNTDAAGSRPLIYALGLALAALLLAGIPFWTVNLAVNLHFPNSRGIISFVPGACLLFAVLLALLPVPQRLRLGMLALMVGVGAGFQFQTATIFRRDATIQNNLLWQLSWRAPAIQPATALLINDLPLHYSTDNSMTAAVNWVYALGNPYPRMPYIFYYPTLRQGSGLPGLQKGLPIHQDYLATDFYGSTSQVLALIYQPPGCVRILDPQLDPLNAMLPVAIRSAAVLSNNAAILTQDPARRPPAAVFGPEPPHTWCYYFEQADLAARQGDWAKVIMLGKVAFSLNDRPNDPAERMPFIEGYAHSGNWAQALTLSRETRAITPLMQPVLCRLWQRIDAGTPTFADKDNALKTVRGELKCGK